MPHLAAGPRRRQPIRPEGTANRRSLFPTIALDAGVDDLPGTSFSDVITLTPLAAFVAGAVVLLLVVVGACALFIGLRARSEAAGARAEGARLHALLRGAPALAMAVANDGRVEMPRRLADWLGLREPARFLGELAGDDLGLSASDVQALTADIAGVQRAGQGIRARRPPGRLRAHADAPWPAVSG